MELSEAESDAYRLCETCLVGRRVPSVGEAALAGMWGGVVPTLASQPAGEDRDPWAAPVGAGGLDLEAAHPSFEHGLASVDQRPVQTVGCPLGLAPVLEPVGTLSPIWG